MGGVTVVAVTAIRGRANCRFAIWVGISVTCLIANYYTAGQPSCSQEHLR